MTKNKTNVEPDAKITKKSTPDVMRLASLAGLVVLVVFSFLIWRSIAQIQVGLDSRLSGIETKLENMAVRPNTAAANTPPPRGPDPSRVYRVNTAGRPVQGSPAAIVTIAEFSDFQ